MLTEACTHALDVLRGAGLAAALDPRDLTIPGVWITVDTATRDRLDQDSGTVVVQLVAVGSGSGHSVALVELDQLLAAVDAAVTVDDGWRGSAIRLPNHSQALLPCMRASLTIEVSP